MTPRPASGFRFFDLDGKTLLITGVTRGIGRALLPGLAEQGLKLVLVSRGRERMEEAVREAGIDPARVSLFDCDLADAAAVEATAREIAEKETAIDYLLHNAAIDPRHRFETAGQSFWENLFQVNLFASVALTRHLLPHLRNRTEGRILFTGSVMDQLGGACLTAYVASKGAITGLTRALAHELKGTGITVNCIVPGAIAVEKESGTKESNDRLTGWQSVPRRLTPHDLLGLLCLLLSPAGGGISGQSITVDGGILHPLADPALQGRNLG